MDKITIVALGAVCTLAFLAFEGMWQNQVAIGQLAATEAHLAGILDRLESDVRENLIKTTIICERLSAGCD